MYRALRPRRIDEVVVNRLLHIINHALFVVESIGCEQQDSGSGLHDDLRVLRPDCRCQILNEPLN